MFLMAMPDILRRRRVLSVHILIPAQRRAIQARKHLHVPTRRRAIRALLDHFPKGVKETLQFVRLLLEDLHGRLHLSGWQGLTEAALFDRLACDPRATSYPPSGEALPSRP